jgi:hypothetical protein
MNDLLLYAVISLCMLALAFILWNGVRPSRRVKVRNLGGGASENYGWNRHKRTGQNG